MAVVYDIEFAEPTTELVVTFKFRGPHDGVADIEEFPVDPRGQEFPVQYTPDEWTDLAPFMRPHAEDLDGSVAAWARGFLTSAETSGSAGTRFRRCRRLSYGPYVGLAQARSR